MAISTLFRKPKAEDAAAVSALIVSCPPLDQNSLYCTLLQCTDFAHSCIIAEQNGKTIGWISGYRLPGDPMTLFIWQVAVHPDARGSGLAVEMAINLIARQNGRVRRVRTTVTKSNESSRRMFSKLSKKIGSGLTVEARFDGQDHFQGKHESEDLITIRPIVPERINKLLAA